MIAKLSFFFLLLLMLPAPGNGGFKSSLQVLKAVPIPQQTAVIQHQEGKETLTIWNTVEAASQELAWVLPLPAPPEVIQETDASALRMIRMLCAPDVETGGGNLNLFWKTIPIYLLMLMAFWLFVARRGTRTSVIAAGLASIYVGMLGSFLFIGQSKIMAGGGGGPSAAEVTVLREQTAGNFDTTVISGTSAEAVNAWLTGHGFAAFAGRDLQVLEDYIARKWVFFCARLKTGGNGVKETHPLTVSFPADQPVYPMRLTESAGIVPLDLFVIGGNFVRDPSGRLQPWMTLDFSRKRFSTEFRRFSGVLDMQRLMREEVGKGARAEEASSKYLPFVPAGRDVFLDTLMTGGTLVTHLKGTFKPGDNWDDIQLVPTSETAPVRVHYTWAGYLDRILMQVGYVPAFLVVLTGLLAHFRTPVGQRPHRAWGLTASGLLLAVWAGTAVWTGMAVYTRKTVTIVPGEQVVSSGQGNPESGYGQLLTWMNKLSARPAGASP